MGIQVQFQGSTLSRPATYSVSKQSNSNGSQLSTNDTMFIVGESTLGAPGATTGIQSFSSTQISSLIAMYGSGPICDMALAATRVSKDPTVGGAGEILVWKTNHTLQAAINVNESTNTNPLLDLTDPAWGSPGNNKSITIANGSSGLQKNVTIGVIGSPSVALGQNPATPVMTIDYTGNGTASTIVISGSTMANKTLTTTLTGQSDGSVNLSIVLANYTLSQLVAFINAHTGYVAVLSNMTLAATPSNVMDSIASTSIEATVVTLYQLQQELAALITGSGIISAVVDPTPRVGLPVNVSNLFLAGGAQGGSANSDFSTGLMASLAVTYQQVVMGVSEDATADIALLATDPSSTYTILAVQAALASHLALRGSIQNRKEAQGWTGTRSSTQASVYTAAQTLGDAYVQMVLQDVLILDQNSNLTWKQPHVLAAMCAGYRCGVPVGTPLTYKFLNVNGFGQYVNAVTGIAGGDFNPDVNYAAAIAAGVTFLETAKGGSRIVVDNTTYGLDNSFVWNRGSVIEAAIYAAQNIRQVGDDNFIGNVLPNPKVVQGQLSGGGAASLKAAIRSELVALWTASVLATSSDAPQGFVESTFIVTVTGNTAFVSVEFKPIQGLDFILCQFTLGQTQTSA